MTNMLGMVEVDRSDHSALYGMDSYAYDGLVQWTLFHPYGLCIA